MNTQSAPQNELDKVLEKIKERDALHLACAESDEVNVFLTTDDRLLRRAKRYQNRLRIHVENPYTWLQEIENEHLSDDRS